MDTHQIITINVGICYKGFKGEFKEYTHVWEVRHADIKFLNRWKTGQY